MAASGLPSELGDSSAVGRGWADPTTTNSTAITTIRPTTTYNTATHHAPTVIPEAGTAVVELLMMGMRMPETC